MKIYCVCGMGLGSSLIAKMNVEQVLKDNDYEGSVDNCDIATVTGVDADLFITTAEMAKSMPKEYLEKTIILTNFIDIKTIETALLEFLEKKEN